MINLSGVGEAFAASAKVREHAKLADAAQQFEAVFLEQMLKPLQEGDDGGEKSPGSDTMSSYGTEAVAKAIAKGGGLGIARQIVAKVQLERDQHTSANVRKP